MTTVICPDCDFENPERMRFCGQCATLLMSVCPNCGFENPLKFKFCGECATPLSHDSHVAVTPPGADITPTLQPSPSAGISKKDPEEVALGVAREWTRSSIDSISRLLGLAVTEGTPGLQNVASSLIGNQIKQRVEWTYSDPEDMAGGSVSNQQKWDTLGAERSGAGWRSGELPEGPVVASSPFGGLSLHLLPAL